MAYDHDSGGKEILCKWLGRRKPPPLDEAVEVGLFTARPGIGPFQKKDVLVLKRRQQENDRQVIVLKSKAKPAIAGVDPYNFT
jgi:ABC-2 type transport system permease protein